MRKNGKTESQGLMDEYLMKQETVPKQIELKPKTLRSKWEVSAELKKILPFLFGGVVR